MVLGQVSGKKASPRRERQVGHGAPVIDSYAAATGTARVVTGQFATEAAGSAVYEVVGKRLV